MKNTLVRGIIVPFITPMIYDSEGKFLIDEQATENLIEELIAKKIGALFIFGFAGACTKILDVEVRSKHLKEVIKMVNGRVPVLVGVAHEDLEKSKELASDAENSGADGLVILLNQGEASYEEKVAAVVGATKNIPIFLYNNPHVGQKENLTAKNFEELLKKYPERIVGIKESSGNEELFLSYVELLKKYNFSLFMGEATKIKWILDKQKELQFNLLGTVPVEANIPEKAELYRELLEGKNPEGIEYLSIPQSMERLVAAGKIDKATVEFWEKGEKI